jgi:diguanylate cyclase (GGDEF)-like protein/PAS domain S-box-containing protein
VQRVLTFILVLLCFSVPVRSEPLFDVKNLTDATLLESSHGAVVSDRKAISVEIPVSADKTAILELDANGPGLPCVLPPPESEPDAPVQPPAGPAAQSPSCYFWSLYSFTNSSPEARNIVITIPKPGFAGSGFLDPLSSSAQVISAKTSSLVKQFIGTPGPSESVYQFRLEPGQSITTAFEGSRGLPVASAWLEFEYQSRSSRLDSLNGAIFGIVGLLTVSTIALALIRNRLAATACVVFAFTSVLFICMETGLLARIIQTATGVAVKPDPLRAMTESIFGGGLIVALMGFSGANRETKFLTGALWLGVAIICANIGLAYWIPSVATSLARIAFVYVAIQGFLVILRAQRLQPFPVKGAVLFWSAVMFWAGLAIIIAFMRTGLVQATAILLSSLCVVLMVMLYALLQHLFEDTEVMALSQTDTTRESIALTSARHHLWDWQPSQNRIELSADLSRALGYRHDIFEQGGQHTFFEQMHPEDVPDLIEKAGAIAAGTSRILEQDIRIKNADGRYRWYALRAKLNQDSGRNFAHCIGTLTDITKSKEIESRLQTDAVHDPVTGLPSRALFLDRLRRSLANRTGPAVRVLILDLDRFKAFNDGYGPDVGDELLLITGRRIQECLSPEDSATRLTGSQFAIAYSEIAHPYGEEAFATQLMQAVTAPITLAGSEVVLSASVGMSIRGLPGVASEELLAQATSALHSAKADGTGRFKVYDLGMRNERIAQVALEADLRQAIARAEIEVHYQPIINLLTGKIAGFEALARWRHPTLGLIAPDQFINAAEEAGLIGEIGRLVLSEAARQLGIWQRTVARNRTLFIAVNVSASQLLEEEFLATMHHIIQRESLLPDTLKIEVTEAVVMRYPDRVLSLFGVLRDLGISLSCDDFGTGFSSLSTLRDLPFDTLKLDRSFVSEPDDERGSHIIRSVLDMAHGLNMTVVCEGVETPEQAARLTSLGCDYGQGFHFGSAAPPRDVELTLADLPLSSITPPILIHKPASMAPAILPRPQQPLPGRAPLAPRYTVVREGPKEPDLPDELPSIFEVEKMARAKAKPVNRKKPAKKPGKKRKARRSKDSGVTEVG